MALTIGSIGFGNMGSALLGGLASRLDKGKWQFCSCDASAAAMQRAEKMGIKPLPDAASVIRQSDIAILAVKPAQVAGVLQDVSSELTQGKTLFSIAAGVSLATLRKLAGNACAIVRCMPTTTARVCHGVFAFCFDPHNFPRAKQEEILEIFGHIGCCTELPEAKFTEYTSLVGAGPAYVFAMLQGLSQAGITLGFPQTVSRSMLIELIVGCGELARLEPENFAQLRDNVCSPAGVTIAGVNVLDRAGFSGLLVEAVEAANKRGHEMEA